MRKRKSTRANKKETSSGDRTPDLRDGSWSFGLDDELLSVGWSVPPFPAPQPVPERPAAAIGSIHARSLSPAPFAGPVGIPAQMRTVVAMPARRPPSPGNGNAAIAYPARSSGGSFGGSLGFFGSDTMVFEGGSEAG